MILDCHSLESAHATLAKIIGIKSDALGERLRQFLVDDWPDNPPDVLWDSIVGGPRDFDGVYWFHLTRTLTPHLFRESGILPLNLAIEKVWETIFQLIGDRQTLREKECFRRDLRGIGQGEFIDAHSARLFFMKTQGAMHWGPYGMLVREVAFQPTEISHHDYLRVPEIIEDICNCHPDGEAMLAEFYRVSKPCIVKFRGGNDRPDVLPTALFYLWTAQNGDFPCRDGNTCFDGRGAIVAPERIADVEVVKYP